MATPRPLARPAASAASAAPTPVATRTGWRRLLTTENLFFLLCALVIFAGWRLPLHRYLTPESGAGYVLGIVGAILMLLLLLYPARKRVRWLNAIGSVRHWFRIHMVLGVLGPICILFHANFSTGAINSNVALFSMLIVSSSGLAGRYFYSKIHHGLYGHAATLQELQAHAQRLRTVESSVSFLPDLLDRVEQEEQRLLHTSAGWPLLLRPVCAAWMASRARRRLHRYAVAALAARAREATPAQIDRLRLMADGYSAQRIHAARRIAEYQAYARLFSWWHIMHLPLFVMLLIAALVHVVAVHVY